MQSSDKKENCLKIASSGRAQVAFAARQQSKGKFFSAKPADCEVAVALDYKNGSPGAPLVAASGQDHMAQKIVEIAKRFGVPIVENEHLAQSLKGLPIDCEIPEDLFEAVALILCELEKES